jgi:putative membrane protein
MGAEGETTVWQGNPSWKSMLLFYVKWTLVSLLPVAAWVALNAGGSDISATWFAVATGIGLVLTYVVGWIKRQTTRYLVTDRRIHIRTGIMSRNERTTHVDRVQNVNLRQSIFQRMLGIGDVDWDTAGTDAADADFTFRGVDDPSGLVRAADRYYGVAAVHETAQREPQ